MKEAMQNKKVTDTGWKAMRSLLDQEMPLEPRRRRFIWWWFALLLLPILGYGAWELGSSNTDKVETPLPQADSVPFAATSPDDLQTQANASENETSRRGFEIKNNTQKQANVVSGQRLNKQSSRQQPSQVVSNQPKTSTANGPVQADNQVIELKGQENAIPILDISQESSTDMEVSARDKVVLVPIFAVLPDSELPLLSRSVDHNLSGQIVTLPNIEPTKIKKSNPGSWSLGGTVGISTERFKMINKYDAGLAVHWQSAGRFGIRTGLKYAAYRVSGPTNLAATVDLNQYESALNSGYSLLDSAGNQVVPNLASPIDQVLIPVSKIKLLELPLMVSWEISRPIKLFAGINTAYIWSANTNDDSYLSEYRLKVNSTADAASLNTLAANGIQRWRFDFLTGVGLKLNNVFEIGLRASFPLLSASSSIVYGSFDQTTSTGSYNPSNSKATTIKRYTPSCSVNATCFFMRSR